LTLRYRGGGVSDETIGLAAYLTARLPATFAAVSAVLAKLRIRRPSFSPSSVLDVGSGPGTASWAAAHRWPDIGRFVMVDNNHVFLSLAQRLAQGSPGKALAGVEGRSGDLTRLAAENPADLVIAAYSLAELPRNMLAEAVDSLWRATRGILVLVEPGTPAAFARLRMVRRQLLGLQMVPVAPCPHAVECPLAGNDWCHFSVRLPRSRAHMHAKDARVPFEDEKFAYLVMARDGEPTGGGRVLAPPRKSKAGLSFKLCTATGRLDTLEIARRDHDAYKVRRKTDWGDLIDPAS
jgi:ribosomal protein RSM22 (predicted rRNA methylase)